VQAAVPEADPDQRSRQGDQANLSWNPLHGSGQHDRSLRLPAPGINHASGTSGNQLRMRRSLASLASLALSAGCLNSVAQSDGGGSDGGDAGICTDDSQCASGFYCDLSLTQCPWDGGLNDALSILNAGSCLVDCSKFSSCPAVCQVGEDCPPWQSCIRWTPMDGGGSIGFPCTAQQPCDAGSCGNVPCPGPPWDCPADCRTVSVPHSCTTGCVCPGNGCSLPGDGGLQDSGS